MRAKYNYRVAIQEARVVRCSKLKEAEATYSEAPSENAAMKSLYCATLCREHAKYMSELEEWALEAENRSWQDFLSAHQAILCHAPQSLKEDLHSSYYVLLGNLSSSLQSAPSARVPQTQGWPPMTIPPRLEPKWSPQSKRWHSLPDAQGDTSIDESSPMALQEGPSSSKRGKTADWYSSLKPSHADTFRWGWRPHHQRWRCQPCHWTHPLK